MNPIDNVRLVALREIQVRARSRAFLLSTAFILLVAVGGIGGARFAGDIFGEFEPRYDLGIVDADPESMAATVHDVAARLDIDLDVHIFDADGEANDALIAGDVDAVLIDREFLRFAEAVSDQLNVVANEAVRLVRLPAQLEDLGLTFEEIQPILQPAPLQTSVIDAPDDDEIGSLVVASVSAIFLFIAIITYGQWVLIGVVEEKSSRVVEVLLSAVRPYQLLAGKILGILALGGIQLAVLAIAGGSTLFLAQEVELPAVAIQGIFAAALWFLLGLVFYGFCFGVAGALVSRQEEASNVTLPITLVLTGGYMFTIISVVNDPAGTAAIVVSLLPFTAPLAMPVRVALGEAAAWEFVLSVTFMFAAIGVAIWLGGRIYTGAILRMGPRVALREAWRFGR